MIPVFFRKINVVFFHWVNLFIISPEIIIQGAEVAPALVKGTANQIACVTVQMRISGDCAFGVGVKRNFSDFNTFPQFYFLFFILKKKGRRAFALRPVQMGNCWVTISALQAGGCNALDEVLLQGQEYDQDRDQCDNGSRHDQAILGRVLADEHF